MERCVCCHLQNRYCVWHGLHHLVIASDSRQKSRVWEERRTDWLKESHSQNIQPKEEEDVDCYKNKSREKRERRLALATRTTDDVSLFPFQCRVCVCVSVFVAHNGLLLLRLREGLRRWAQQEVKGFFFEKLLLLLLNKRMTCVSLLLQWLNPTREGRRCYDDDVNSAFALTQVVGPPLPPPPHRPLEESADDTLWSFSFFFLCKKKIHRRINGHRPTDRPPKKANHDPPGVCSSPFLLLSFWPFQKWTVTSSICIWGPRESKGDFLPLPQYLTPRRGIVTPFFFP